MEKFEVNPHEREARDFAMGGAISEMSDFNPHEREARDQMEPAAGRGRGLILIHTSVKLVTPKGEQGPIGPQDFNPHEREARDLQPIRTAEEANILIHTSVKLVTIRRFYAACCSTKF